MRKFERPGCYHEGQGVYPLCIGDGSSLCKRCQLWESYPDSPEEPNPPRNYTRVDEITIGMEIDFLRKQKNLYVPPAAKGKPDAYRIVEDFDTGERVFITVDRDNKAVTDIKTEEEMENEKNRPRRFGETITL